MPNANTPQTPKIAGILNNSASSNKASLSPAFKKTLGFTAKMKFTRFEAAATLS